MRNTAVHVPSGSQEIIKSVHMKVVNPVPSLTRRHQLRLVPLLAVGLLLIGCAPPWHQPTYNREYDRVEWNITYHISAVSSCGQHSSDQKTGSENGSRGGLFGYRVVLHEPPAQDGKPHVALSVSESFVWSSSDTTKRPVKTIETSREGPDQSERQVFRHEVRLCPIVTSTPLPDTLYLEHQIVVEADKAEMYRAVQRIKAIRDNTDGYIVRDTTSIVFLYDKH